jgi:hypothetical protein
MSRTRVKVARVKGVFTLNAAILLLLASFGVHATEALPMDSRAPECPPASTEESRSEPVLSESGRGSASVGLDAQPGLPGAATQPARSDHGGGDESSAPASGSRWNAFLPGMVR